MYYCRFFNHTTSIWLLVITLLGMGLIPHIMIRVSLFVALRCFSQIKLQRCFCQIKLQSIIYIYYLWLFIIYELIAWLIFDGIFINHYWWDELELSYPFVYQTSLLISSSWTHDLHPYQRIPGYPMISHLRSKHYLHISLH